MLGHAFSDWFFQRRGSMLVDQSAHIAVGQNASQSSMRIDHHQRAGAPTFAARVQGALHGGRDGDACQIFPHLKSQRLADGSQANSQHSARVNLVKIIGLEIFSTRHGQGQRVARGQHGGGGGGGRKIQRASLLNVAK